ncbi:MAG: N-acetyltransferase [Bacteroidota bacterium]|jgi:predicted GNAT family acetyltransferase|nr:N-acetyltransferase [Bacteroidota bacterium]
MEIKQLTVGSKGVFYVEEENEHLAELGYHMSDSSTLVIDHTEVDKKLSGKGIGKQLVTKSVEFARANKLTIKPVCSYAKSLFDKIREWDDVLAK